MSFHQPRRRRGADPALLRQLRGEPPMSAVDKRATPMEKAFAAFTTAVMLLISAYMVLV